MKIKLMAPFWPNYTWAGKAMKGIAMSGLGNHLNGKPRSGFATKARSLIQSVRLSLFCFPTGPKKGTDVVRAIVWNRRSITLDFPE